MQHVIFLVLFIVVLFGLAVFAARQKRTQGFARPKSPPGTPGAERGEGYEPAPGMMSGSSGVGAVPPRTRTDGSRSEGRRGEP